ncbi:MULTISPECIES: glycoside hydrolase family 52 protein [unclassified Agarivorans]|uniref:glycoside hydrolase family 52 protein n=1 Tax=unclassified Agarivorans TaxID=2636026 RepID=UPI0026E29E80|nr:MULTISPECIES: glycoside hydrolase family 52 protein [unclassified Agarivorans]MDO6686529.1 glycoside hydrolase family 52 protein [Agarivorans sp. 3_MG-2023]MDO6715347.1 glycoside hydrolase family 52 protein [Agarivorans sp. 2_MG-2023]
MEQNQQFFHAHHSPMGALASFTVGESGEHGGMGLELGAPFAGNIFVGYQDGEGVVNSFPFYKGANDQSERYVQKDDTSSLSERVFENVERDYQWASDTFSAPGISFNVLSPFFEIPDPALAQHQKLKQASCPAVYVELSFDNTSDQDWTGFFALQGDDLRWNKLLDGDNNGMLGVTCRDNIGLATTCKSATAFSHFSVQSALSKIGNNDCFMLGPTAGFMVDVKAGEKVTLRLALGFYLGGNATFNRAMQYYYTQHFTGLNDVLSYALGHFDEYAAIAKQADKELQDSALSAHQQYLLAHATRSYYGSTQWLFDGTESVWVVNEGEYLMMNTLDLTVDMLFFELTKNPWTVKNTLKQFLSHYSFYDEVFDPEHPEVNYPGGLSFTHDMGVSNNWSPKGESSYEVAGLDRVCFSHMTYEQLTNWVLCCGVYISKTADKAFAIEQRGTLIDCLQSLLNRDNPNPELRDGIMGFESARTQQGGEITTYDSLDHSLGQARGNIYLAGKSWAAYLAIAKVLQDLGETEQVKLALGAAKRCADKLSASFDKELGYIPAVLDGHSTSAIIPAIEALVYPYEMGLSEAVSEQGPYGEYIKVLKAHLEYVLNEGFCLYPDGAWKLSSTADNSWVSKIYLNQYVARKILKIEQANSVEADAAHLRWQTIGASKHACCDQFSSGKPIGSLYYPRCVTNILWLDE